MQETNTALQLRADALGREAMQDALRGLANRRKLHLVLSSAHADAKARDIADVDSPAQGLKLNLPSAIAR